MWWNTTNVGLAITDGKLEGEIMLMARYDTEIGHEKAQSVIDSITSSYADAGQANPMLQPPAGAGGFPPPFPGILPGISMILRFEFLI
jgi:hypothetical protein